MLGSLFVIFISAWDTRDDNFLDQIMSSYPTVLLKPDQKAFIEKFELLGGGGLCSALAQNEIKQKKLAGPDRYGLLTEVFSANNVSLEKDDWHYLEYPHNESLQESTALEVPEMFKQLDEFLRSKRGVVVFSAISQLWALSKYDNPSVFREAKSVLSKAVTNFVEKAVDDGARVLLVADSALDPNEPLPCVLIHNRVDGLRAGKQDALLKKDVTGSLYDVPSTIAFLMGTDLEEGYEGKNLFPELAPRTL